MCSVVDVSESGSLSQIAKERFGTRMGRLIFLCILLNNFGNVSRGTGSSTMLSQVC